MKTPKRLTKDQLRARRLALGLSQSGLAKALGVSIPTVSRWETGGNKVPPYVTLALDGIDRANKRPMDSSGEPRKTTEVRSIPHAASIVRSIQVSAENVNGIISLLSNDGDEWLVNADPRILKSMSKSLRGVASCMPRLLADVGSYLEDLVGNPQ